MTAWLDMKKAEVNRQRLEYGDKIMEWDAPKYLKIIEQLQREIRRLKVALGGKRV